MHRGEGYFLITSGEYRNNMGFALWMMGDVVWAQGTHEYKPMGAAVIAASSMFRARDFSPKRKPPRRSVEGFAGLFASLEDINRHLARTRSRTGRRNLRRPSGLVIPTI